MYKFSDMRRAPPDRASMAAIASAVRRAPAVSIASAAGPPHEPRARSPRRAAPATAPPAPTSRRRRAPRAARRARSARSRAISANGTSTAGGAGGEDVEHGVVAGLADRDPAAPQHAVENRRGKRSTTTPFGQLRRQRRELRRRQIGAGQRAASRCAARQPRRRAASAAAAARRRRHRRRPRPGPPPAPAAPASSQAGSGARDIAGIDEPVGDLRRQRKTRLERDQLRVAMHQHGVEIGAHARDDLARARLASSGATTMSRNEHSTSARGRRARAAAISGSSSKRKARRPNG